MLLGRSQSPSATKPSTQAWSNVESVVTSSSSTQAALGSTHAKPPFWPQVKSSVLTQVHSQQSPPSYPEEIEKKTTIHCDIFNDIVGVPSTWKQVSVCAPIIFIDFALVFSRLPAAAVSQIRGPTAGSLAPSPLPYVPSFVFYLEKNSASSSLADSPRGLRSVAA